MKSTRKVVATALVGSLTAPGYRGRCRGGGYT